MHGNIIPNNANVALIPADGHVQVQCNTLQKLVPEKVSEKSPN